MHYLVASWDPSLRLEQPARDVGDLPWSMVLCIFPCVPVFLRKFCDIGTCWDWSFFFEVGQVSGKIEFKIQVCY